MMSGGGQLIFKHLTIFTVWWVPNSKYFKIAVPGGMWRGAIGRSASTLPSWAQEAPLHFFNVCVCLCLQGSVYQPSCLSNSSDKERTFHDKWFNYNHDFAISVVVESLSNFNSWSRRRCACILEVRWPAISKEKRGKAKQKECNQTLQTKIS